MVVLFFRKENSLFSRNGLVLGFLIVSAVCVCVCVIRDGFGLSWNANVRVHFLLESRMDPSFGEREIAYS